MARDPPHVVLATQLEPATELLERAASLDPDDAEIAVHTVRLTRQRRVLRKQAQLLSCGCPVPAGAPRAVERVGGAALGPAEFARRFAGPGIPVVLTDVVDTHLLIGSGARWTPEFIAARAGQRRVTHGVDERRA